MARYGCWPYAKQPDTTATGRCCTPTTWHPCTRCTGVFVRQHFIVPYGSNTVGDLTARCTVDIHILLVPLLNSVNFEYLLLVLAFLLFGTALWLKRSTGVPWKPLRYVDTGGWRPTEQPLISRRYNLVGKPDYIVQTRAGQIPIEVKPKRTATAPYESDLVQLMAYCLLIEDTTGHAPRYGLLRYAKQTFQVPYTSQRRDEILALIAAIEDDCYADEVSRSHHQVARCRNCGFFDQCDDRLKG